MMKRCDCNPLNDYLFKFIFGREERKRITLNFLNAVLDLDGEDELCDINFVDRELDPVFEDDKLSRLDLFGIANDGSRINIEVQLVNLQNMEKRTLYYWAKMYQSLHRGDAYEELNRAITINLLNFSMLPQKQTHTMYGLYDLQSGHRLTEDLEIHFIEIPNFKVKSVKELKRLERWIAYFSTKLNDEETEALAMSETAIREAMDAEYVFMHDEVERWQYEQREKAMRDYISGMRAWRREGLKQGIAEGIQQGIEQGIQQGIAEGIQQGIQQGIEQTSLQNIKSLMKNMNLSDVQAMEILQIPVSEQKKYSDILHS